MEMAAFIENVPQQIVDRVDELNSQLKSMLSLEGLNKALREYADIAFGNVAAYNRFSNDVKNINRPDNAFNARLNELIESSPNGQKFFDNLRELASNADQKDMSSIVTGNAERPTAAENAAREIYNNANGGLRAFKEMVIQGYSATMEKGQEQSKSLADSILKSGKDIAKKDIIPFERRDLSDTLKKAEAKVQADSISKNVDAPAKDAITRGPVGP